MFVTDYLFYRFATWFYKGDGPSGVRASLVVSIMCTCAFWALSYSCFCLVMGSTVTADNWLNNRHHMALTGIMGSWVCIATIIYRNYCEKYSVLQRRWQADANSVAVGKTCLALSVLVLVLYTSYAACRYLEF